MARRSLEERRAALEERKRQQLERAQRTEKKLKALRAREQQQERKDRTRGMITLMGQILKASRDQPKVLGFLEEQAGKIEKESDREKALKVVRAERERQD
jgi:hypothetical protein